jgi:hypothetical protein
MERMKKRRRLLWELKGSWIVEQTRDGAILFYPHGWGSAYKVPDEGKRREIERFLTLWLLRLRCAIRVSRWVSLPAILILIATIFPPFCRGVWYISGWRILFRFALVLWLGCLLTVASPLVLMFLAETTKADLEKAEVRRPFLEILAERARHSSWKILWVQVILFGLALLEGVWLLWPVRRSVVLPAGVNPHFLVGTVLTALSASMMLTKLWQIRIKLQS